MEIKSAWEILSEFDNSPELNYSNCGEAMKAYAEQFIDLATIKAEVYISADGEATLAKQSILKLKELIK